jgi:hypothetical protein
MQYVILASDMSAKKRLQAGRNIGTHSTEKALALLVRFAYDPMDKPSQRVSRRWTLNALLTRRISLPGKGGLLQPLANESALDEDHLTDDGIRQKQADLQHAIALFTDEGGQMLSVKVAKSVLQGTARSPSMLFVSGAIRDVLLEIACYVLVSAPTGRLLVCPVCQKKFVRVGRGKYCSRRCTNRAGWARLPKQRLEAYRRRQYEPMGWTRGARS